jgi:hypothetical protein
VTICIGTRLGTSTPLSTEDRRVRSNSPSEALVALADVLKQIRNKRVHGFKTRKGVRDGVISGAARPLLLKLVGLAM